MMGGLSKYALSALIGSLATIITQKVSTAWRLWSLSNSLQAMPENIPNGYRVRVFNPGKYSIKGAVAYISLTFDTQNDIVNGENSAFININNRIPLNEDRLCWSAAAPKRNPVAIDIYPGEKQALDLVMFDFRNNRIQIPSEQGWSNTDRQIRSRVYLQGKRYEGSIHIVSKNTIRRSFNLVIDASSEEPKVELKPQNFADFWDFFLGPPQTS